MLQDLLYNKQLKARTGDILLFRDDKSWRHRLQRIVTWSNWDHVGIIKLVEVNTTCFGKPQEMAYVRDGNLLA